MPVRTYPINILVHCSEKSAYRISFFADDGETPLNLYPYLTVVDQTRIDEYIRDYRECTTMVEVEVEVDYTVLPAEPEVGYMDPAIEINEVSIQGYPIYLRNILTDELESLEEMILEDI